MAQYEYVNSSTGNLKVSNVVFSFNKETGIVRFDLDLKALDTNTSDGNNVEIKIVYNASAKTTTIVTAPLDKTIPYSITWNAGAEFSLKDWGDRTVTLQIDDESDNSLTYDRTIPLDLDPVEYNLTITSHNFGADSTPDIIWTLSDLFTEQFMNVPTLTVTEGGATANTLTVYLDDGDDTTTAVVIGTGGIVNLNGIAMKDSSVPLDNTKTYFKRIDSYKLTSPTMVEGLNDFSIDLECEVI